MNASPPLRVLALTSHPDNSIARIRLGTPLDTLAQQHLIDWRLRSVKQCRLRDVLAAQLVIIQREATTTALQWARLARALGRPIIYEIDDLLTAPEPHLQHYSTLLSHAPRVHDMLMLADCISVSTARLQAALPPQVQSKCKLTPNHGQPCPLPPAHHDDSDANAPLTLVLASSDAMGLEVVIEGIAQWQTLHARPHKIIAVGPMAKRLAQELAHVEPYPTMSLQAFERLVCSKSNPIGLIPLDASPFNACKSAVKFFHFSTWGIPVIASKTPPYEDVIQDGCHGLLAQADATSWYQAIEQLACSANRRREMVAAAQNLVTTAHNLPLTAGAWRAMLMALRPDNLPQLGWRRWHWIPRYDWLPTLRDKIRQLNERRKQARRRL